MTWDVIPDEDAGDYVRVELGVDGETRFLDKLNRLHRVSGPAIVWPSGRREWWERGYRHRPDGPAIEHPDGTCEWFSFDLRHRLDGPAVTRLGGEVEYWYEDQQLTKSEFDERVGPITPNIHHPGALP